MKIQRDVVAPFALDVLSASLFPPQLYSRPHQCASKSVKSFFFLPASFHASIRSWRVFARSFTAFGTMPLSLAAMMTRSEGRGSAFSHMLRISLRKMFTVTSPMPFAREVSLCSRSVGSAADVVEICEISAVASVSDLAHVQQFCRGLEVVPHVAARIEDRHEAVPTRIEDGFRRRRCPVGEPWKVFSTMLSDMRAPKRTDARNHLKISWERLAERSMPSSVENLPGYPCTSAVIASLDGAARNATFQVILAVKYPVRVFIASLDPEEPLPCQVF